METVATRQELRRRLQARLGLATNAAQAPLNQEQFNEFLRAAAQEVHARCAWSRARRTTTVHVGIDQRFVNYPPHCGSGELHAIAWWDEAAGRHHALRRGVIGLALDDAPLVESGEPGSLAGRGRPTRYQAGARIELWPRPDRAYRLTLEHTIDPEFADDATPSVVDAECILLWAMADAYEFQGEGDLAGVQRAKFDGRIARLISAQTSVRQIRRGAHDRRLVGNRGAFDDYQPTSGRWPSVLESP